jgi:hypothetical protein
MLLSVPYLDPDSNQLYKDICEIIGNLNTDWVLMKYWLAVKEFLLIFKVWLYYKRLLISHKGKIVSAG